MIVNKTPHPIIIIGANGEVTQTIPSDGNPIRLMAATVVDSVTDEGIIIRN